MAIILPFRAQRFSPHVGELAHLVAPPYDVISSEGRENLGSRSPYNTVWLTLPEAEPDDRSQFIKYGRSSSRLAAWRDEGVLVVDDQPSLYRYRQTFIDPVSGKKLTRESLITLIKTEPYEKGVVLPHEQTFPKHKEDRLRLLEATRTHLECIYGLYEDVNADVGTALAGTAFEVVADITTEDSVTHELAKSSAVEEIERITSAFAAERVWIADGHHRYETAVSFREAMGEQPGPVPEDYMMIALSSMSDPGLVLLPTHRVVKDFPVPWDQVEEKLQGRFHTREVANDQIHRELCSLDKPDARVFGVALHGGRGLILTMNEPADALAWIGGDASDLQKMLDVTILHEAILKDLFGISGSDKISYTRDAKEAISAPETDPQTVSFLMNPPSISDMRLIALGGEKMPQKSTYYYPKLLSGLLFWSMNDFK
ncbi:MAG: DUF1015 domain-containing protein [Armatimonadota bacterium]|nr:DUF1015 domain-containing protein [Armatimonadota bacterium]